MLFGGRLSFVLLHRARLPLVEEEEDEHEVHDEPGYSQPRGEGIGLGERLGRKSPVFAKLVHLFVQKKILKKSGSMRLKFQVTVLSQNTIVFCFFLGPEHEY